MSGAACAIGSAGASSQARNGSSPAACGIGWCAIAQSRAQGATPGCTAMLQKIRQRRDARLQAIDRTVPGGIEQRAGRQAGGLAAVGIVQQRVRLVGDPGPLPIPARREVRVGRALFAPAGAGIVPQRVEPGRDHVRVALRYQPTSNNPVAAMRASIPASTLHVLVLGRLQEGGAGGVGRQAVQQRIDPGFALVAARVALQ